MMHITHPLIVAIILQLNIRIDQNRAPSANPKPTHPNTAAVQRHHLTIKYMIIDRVRIDLRTNHRKKRLIQIQTTKQKIRS